MLRLGDRVVVEHPGFPPMLDLLDQMGCVVVGVDVDDDGPTVAGLRAALAAGDVRAVMLQPRAQNPAGSRLTTRRAKALADVLAAQRRRSSSRTTTPTTSRRRRSSASARGCPARTVHIRSYSKSHGPDLRLAAVGGAGDVVTAVANRRLLGPGLVEPHPAGAAARAAAGPGDAGGDGPRPGGLRPTAGRWCATCWPAAGVGVTGVDGINLWVRVADERSAAVALAARGIGVAPGEPFLVRPDDDHLRVTVGLLTGPDDHVREIATHLAHAAGHPPTRQTHHR